jgi:TetR/AcrR family transcriptional regulator, cholesterol catabolism regulator
MLNPPLLSELTPSQQQRRARIVAAGLALLRREDYDKIQVRDVADEADVAVGTLYRYFQSKEHLFAEVLAEWAETLRTRVERSPLQGATNTARLQEVLHRSVRAFQAWPQLVRVLMTLEASSDPFAAEIFTSMNTSIHAVWAEALVGLPDEVVATVVKVVGATLDLLLRQWVTGRVSINDVYAHLERAVVVLLEFSE